MSNVTAIRPAVPFGDDEVVLMSPAQVSELVPGLSVRTLRELRAAGKGPAYFKPTEKTVVYERADVLAWVQAHRERTREQS